MKKIITTASLAAFGAVSLQAAYAPGLTPTETSKPWSISASLRGFYDDNYNLRPSHVVANGREVARDSFGVEISPSAGFNWAMDQTFLGLNYTYSLRWYDARKNNSADHTHQASLKLDHAFTDNAKLALSDGFTITQEPQLGGVVEDPTVLRSHGDNLRNAANAQLNWDLSRQFGVELAYSNTLYDYDQRGAGSYSALLDRMEHLGRIDFRWQALPATVAVLGYKYGVTDYTSKDSLVAFFPYVSNTVSDPKIRNNSSHYVYLGADQTLASEIRASVRAGLHYTEYFNALPGSRDNSLTPYVDASLSYAYAPGSSAQLGVRHDKNQTDLYPNPIGSDVTLDQETTSVYAVINHKLTAKLTANLTGQLQYSSFKGGAANDEIDTLYLIGLNLTYQFNPNIALETGYNYDRLDSDITGRGFERNRVYIGVRASY